MAKKERFIITLPRAVASFCHLDKPDPGPPPKPGMKPGEPKYKVRSVFDGDTDFSALEAKIVAAIAHEWPKVKPSIVRSCLKSGNDYNEQREANGKDIVESLVGKFFVEGGSKFQPETVDTKKNPISADKIRAGDIIRSMIELIPCEPNGTKTIGVRLLAVMLVEKRANADGWSNEMEEETGYVDDSDDTLTGASRGGRAGDASAY